jgi:hypothetical protein
MVAANMTPAQIAEAQRLAREWQPTFNPAVDVVAVCLPGTPQDRVQVSVGGVLGVL